MLNYQKKRNNLFYMVLGLPATAMGFGLSIQIAVLSWILSTKFGLDIHEIGIVWAAGPLAGILGQPIIGLISDNFWFWGGRRRPFIIIGGVLTAVAVLALPNIDIISTYLGIGSLMAVAITVALTLDLAINISFNPTRSIIADVTPDGEPRTKGYTWMQSVSNLFGSLAYLTGAIFGNYFLIYSGAVVILLFSIVPLFFIEEPRILQKNDESENNPSSKTQWSELMKIYFAHSFSWLGVQSMFIYIIFFINQKMNIVSAQQSGQIIGISFFILNAVSFPLPALVLEPLSRKIGRVNVHIFSLIIMALGYFAIAFFARDAISLYILMCLVCVGWAAVVSLPFAIMSEKVDKSRMGFFMGIFNLSVVLPQLVSSFAIGLLIKSLSDKSSVFLIAGISISISAFLWIFVKENRK